MSPLYSICSQSFCCVVIDVFNTCKLSSIFEYAGLPVLTGSSPWPLSIIWLPVQQNLGSLESGIPPHAFGPSPSSVGTPGSGNTTSQLWLVSVYHWGVALPWRLKDALLGDAGRCCFLAMSPVPVLLTVNRFVQVSDTLCVWAFAGWYLYWLHDGWAPSLKGVPGRSDHITN